MHMTWMHEWMNEWRKVGRKNGRKEGKNDKVAEWFILLFHAKATVDATSWRWWRCGIMYDSMKYSVNWLILQAHSTTIWICFNHAHVISTNNNTLSYKYTHKATTHWLSDNSRLGVHTSNNQKRSIETYTYKEKNPCTRKQWTNSCCPKWVKLQGTTY